MSHRLYSAFKFAIPLLVLLLVWEFSIQFFQVNARVFPSIESVFKAGLEAVNDGSLVKHIAASLGRVAVGTLIAIVVSIPLGVAMGLNPIVSDFLSPLFRFFSVLAGIAWIPIATLWFGYGFGAITFVIFNAVFFVVTYNTLLGVASIPMPLSRSLLAMSPKGVRTTIFRPFLISG
jgi:NitT/TauT family transport system permease protein/taurine transport system permease protein